ncbi:hypothetical protein BGX21_001580, partial [Mortierella sp. AD011]
VPHDSVHNRRAPISGSFGTQKHEPESWITHQETTSPPLQLHRRSEHPQSPYTSL